MAGEDYSVKTKVTADVSNFEKGMNKAEKSLKGFSDKLANSIDRLGKKGLIGSVANVTLAMQGLTKSFGTVIKFAKDVGKAINECTEAYKGQIIAERALDTAIQNNPFISGESSKALKQFASEMQKVTNYGDEELIPMMTNLVSLGRTESEVMQIMSVAMDMSAGMGISLDTAITQLNATLNGNIGRLGQQNAELKGLTEEELKQGKAIEILGEKFKGLSSATADTSKQLQNIKGDFKEALGQFTLPSSDMWNKFWAGFYERGIEVIGKINAYIDAQTIGRKLASEYVKQIKAISTEKVYNPETGIYDVRDLGARVKYIREALKVLSDEELEALNNYLSSQRRLNDEEQQLLNRIKAEQDSRYQGSINAKKEAEEKKKQAVAEEQITAELQKQEEVAKKKTDWAGKLLDQRIEMLESERDRAMQLAEEEGQETYTIWRDYNEKILELKLERLEKEKEKALAEEGLTAEDKIKIEEYYSGETKKIYDELGNYKRKKNEEEKKETKKTFSEIVSYTKQYAEKIKQIFSKVLSTIKNIFSGAVNLFNKLFSIDPDEILNNVLKIEDKILTFFLNVMPNISSLAGSIIESIVVLLRNIRGMISASDIRSIVRSILRAFTDNLPTIINDTLIVLEELIDGLIDGLVDWVESDSGIEKLLKVVLTIQKALEKIVTKGLTKLLDMLDDKKGAFSQFLAESIASANRTLPVILKAVLRLIAILIEAIAGAFESEDFVNSIVESIERSIDAIIEMIPRILGGIIKLIVNIISALIPHLPEIIMYTVQAIGEALPSMAGQIAGSLVKGISQIFQKIFTVEFWGDVLQSFGTSIGEILKSAFLGFDFGGMLGLGGGSSGGGSSGGGGGGLPGSEPGTSWDDPYDWFDPLHLLPGHANGSNGVAKGLALVGEAGPELVKFNGGEQVLNAHNTQKALSNMGGKTNNFNVTFNNLKDTSAFAMMNQLKQYNRQMAINSII